MSRSPVLQPPLKHRLTSFYRGSKWWLEIAGIPTLSSGYTYSLYSLSLGQTARFKRDPTSAVCPSYKGGDEYVTA